MFDLTQPILSKDDSHLYGINGNRIAYCNMATGIDESIFEPSDTLIDIIDVSKDENFIVCKDKNGFKIWDTHTGRIIREREIIINTKYLYGSNFRMNIDCDNSKIYLQSYYYFWRQGPKEDITWEEVSLNVYDFNSLDSIDYFDKGKYKFYLSNDCKYLALPYNYLIDIFDLATKQTINTLIDSVSTKRWAKFSNDNRYFIVNEYSSLGGIFIWNVNTGELSKIREHGTFDACDISQNQMFFATSLGNRIWLIDISKTTGIGPEINNLDIIYPNPTNGKIITYKPEGRLNEISFLNLTGQVVKKIDGKEFDVDAGEIRIDLSELTSGMYFLRMSGVGFERVYEVVLDK